MKKHENTQRTCAICGKTFSKHNVVVGEVLRPQITEQIRAIHPGWSSLSFICRSDLANFRMAYVQSLLESEKSELRVLRKNNKPILLAFSPVFCVAASVT
jgi:precorrin-6B methylase 1